VKEYLTPKELQEKHLSPILDAMEVADYTRPGVKKRLLRYVWPDTNHTFEEVFSPYIKERGQQCSAARFTVSVGQVQFSVSVTSVSSRFAESRFADWRVSFSFHHFHF